MDYFEEVIISLVLVPLDCIISSDKFIFFEDIEFLNTLPILLSNNLEPNLVFPIFIRNLPITKFFPKSNKLDNNPLSDSLDNILLNSEPVKNL